VAEETLAERQKRLDQIQREIDLTEKLGDSQKKLSDSYEAIQDLAKRRSEATGEERRILGELLKQQIEYYKVTRDQGLIAGELTTQQIERLKHLHRERERQNELLEEERKALEASNKAKKEALDLGRELTGIQLDQIASVKGLTTELIKMAHSLDAANVALAQTTGYTKAFADDIIDVTEANDSLGITLAEGAEIIGGLTTSMTLFATVNEGARKSLRDTAAALSKMGVSAQETGLLFDGLTRGMNLTVNAAERVAKDFDRLGQQIGLPTSQMVSDFNALQPQLARYGNEGVKVFKKLAKEARSLGMDLQEAFNIAEAFDTFQGAADLAGKLNAQIGLQLNSVELMTASHEDRIKILRQEFDLRGKNFKDMDRRQKQAIAEVLGVDVDLASRLFGDPVELRKYNKEQKEMKERAEAMTTAMDKFKVAMQDLFLKMAPVVETIMSFVQFLADTGIAQVLLFVAAMKGILTVVGTLATTLPVVGPMLASLFTTMGFVAPTMPAFLTNLGASLQAFFAFLGTISPAQIAKGALAIVGLAASLGILGMSLSSFKDIGLDELGTAAGAIVILSLAIVALGAVMYSGIGAIVFAAGVVALLGLAAALTALGLALNLISMALGNKTSGIAGSLDIIANAMARLGSSEVINGIRSFIVELGALAKAFGDFEAASESMASLERIVTVSTTVSTGDLENMKAVMGQVQATFNASRAADRVAMREAATATANAGRSRTIAQARRQPIQLIVNDRVFGEAVMDVYEEATNPLNIS
jgi:hypothetical protein